MTKGSMADPGGKRVRTAGRNPACVVCGSENPKGLQIGFRSNETGVHADWTPTGDWESFQGTIHGGIITTVLDEAMSKAIMGHNWDALTAEIRVRFRKRVSPGDALHIHGWVVARKGRRIQTEATLKTAAGVECAHAWAAFLAPAPTPDNSRPAAATDSAP